MPLYSFRCEKCQGVVDAQLHVDERDDDAFAPRCPFDETKMKRVPTLPQPVHGSAATWRR